MVPPYVADTMQTPEQRRASAKRYRSKYREKLREVSRKNYCRYRQEFLDAYGRSCICCGETQEEFLTLEHLNRDGKLHRKLVGRYVYRDLRRRGWPKDGYALMCWNCNMSRRTGCECPHQTEFQKLFRLITRTHQGLVQPTHALGVVPQT